MNCTNCGASVVSQRCDYCGSAYPDFKETRVKSHQYEPNRCPMCGGSFSILTTDYDPEDLACRVQIRCNNCPRKTKIYKVYAYDYDSIGYGRACYLKIQEALDAFQNGSL